MATEPDVPFTVEWEHDDAGTFNVWCSLCLASRPSLQAHEAQEWGDDHGCLCQLCDNPKHDGPCPEEDDASCPRCGSPRAYVQTADDPPISVDVHACVPRAGVRS